MKYKRIHPKRGAVADEPKYAETVKRMAALLTRRQDEATRFEKK